MFSAASLVLYFQAVSVLAYSLTILKLFRAGLYRRYRFFLAYLLFAVPTMAFVTVWVWKMPVWDPKAQTYNIIFVWIEPVSMLFSVLIVYELYRLVFERYKGLYTLGKWAMSVAMVIAAGFSVAAILPLLAHSGEKHSNWKYVTEVRVEAILDLTLVLFILLILLFLSRYPVRLSRNVLVYTGVYSLFFLSNAVGIIALAFWGLNIREEVSAALIGISSACAIAWLVGLNAKGEEVQVRAPALRTGSEEQLLLQLDAINATLAKISRN